MSIAANILFQFILIMNDYIKAKELFNRLAASYEAICDNINNGIIDMVSTPINNVVCLLYSAVVKFLRKGTAAVCISRYILKIDPSKYNAAITGSCDCIARKSVTRVGRRMRGMGNDGRGTINLPQSRLTRKEKKSISCKGISFKCCNKFISFHHETREGRTALRVTNHEGRKTNSQPRIFILLSNKTTLLRRTETRRNTLNTNDQILTTIKATEITEATEKSKLNFSHLLNHPSTLTPIIRRVTQTIADKIVKAKYNYKKSVSICVNQCQKQ
jgi:hypothetical protein